VALGFSRNPGNGHALKNLAEGLKAEAVRYRLSLGWEAKIENPACQFLINGFRQ